jgi:hypothetical protein
MSILNLKNIYKSTFFYPSAFSTYLGRWKIENEHKTNLKADYANDDHCGICSMNNKNNEYEFTNDDNDYYSMYMIEFVQDTKVINK